MTTEPTTVGGVTIPVGEIVLCSLVSGNRDETRFPRAATLDVCRPDNQHLSFGHGAHRCLGANLAKLQAEVVISALLARYPRIELAVPVAELNYGEVGYLEFIRKLEPAHAAHPGLTGDTAPEHGS